MNFEYSEPEVTDPFELPAMVDMVFLLLSFFVFATQFRVLEQDSSMGYQPEASIVGAAAGDLPENVPIELEAVRAGVAIRVGQSSLAANDFEGIGKRLAQINLPRVPVLLMADPVLSVDQVARALDAVLGSPMTNVSVSVLNPRGGKER